MSLYQNVISILTRLAWPSSLGVQFSTNSTALNAVGADTIGSPPSDIAKGVNVLDVEMCTGLDLDFIMRGGAGVTGTARVWAAFPVGPDKQDSSLQQWTMRHLCDLSLVAAASQTGATGGSPAVTDFYAVVTITDDGGLGPLATRVMKSLLAGGASRTIVDPVCAPRIVVQTTVGTATSIAVGSRKWTRS